MSKPRVTCDTCKETFPDFEGAKHHVRTVHGQGSIIPGGFISPIRVDPVPPPPPAPAGEGRKDDSAKVRIELIAPELLFAVGEISTFGAIKYGDRNWELGMNWSRVFGALMRHMWAWWGGALPTKRNFVFGDLDAETGKSHLWHAACCVMYLIAYEARGTGTDDRPS